jgi:Protein of unknown function (DUF3467)
MRPVELLEQDHPGELVRQRDRTQRQPVVHALQRRRPEGTADHESQIDPTLPALLQEPTESHAVTATPIGCQQCHERPLWHPPGDCCAVAGLDQLQPHITGEQLVVMGHIVLEWRPQSPLAEHEQSHGCDTNLVNDDDSGAERHINIHLSPEVMGGVYANFANVSHSDYEFTVTFARVDHEVEAEEVPGVVVTRVNISPRFMRELIDAMEDNYSKWRTREGIKNLPEYGGTEAGGGEAA